MSETREETIQKRQDRWPEGEYTLLVHRHYDRHVQHDYTRGDTIFLNREDALRLGMANCIAPVDSPEAVKARQNPQEQKQQKIKDMEAELERLKREADTPDEEDE